MITLFSEIPGARNDRVNRIALSLVAFFWATILMTLFFGIDMASLLISVLLSLTTLYFLGKVPRTLKFDILTFSGLSGIGFFMGIKLMLIYPAIAPILALFGVIAAAIMIYTLHKLVWEGESI